MAQNKNIWYIIIFLVVIFALYKMGPTFTGALVTFEGGNEMMFYTEQSHVDEVTGETVIDQALLTEQKRYLQIQSKYTDSALMRLYGTPGLTNSKITITKILYDAEGGLVPTTSDIWQKTADFTEVTELDLTSELNGLKEGDSVQFLFYSELTGVDTGSLIVSSFDVNYGLTAAQVSACTSTGGTFDDTVSVTECSCPAEDTDGNALIAWDKEDGCMFVVPVESVPEEPPLGGGEEPVVCKPSWTCAAWNPAICPKVDYKLYLGTGVFQARTCADANDCGVATGKPSVSQKCEPYISRNTLLIIGLVIAALLIYYFAFEKGPKKGLFKSF